MGCTSVGKNALNRKARYRPIRSHSHRTQARISTAIRCIILLPLLFEQNHFISMAKAAKRLWFAFQTAQGLAVQAISCSQLLADSYAPLAAIISWTSWAVFCRVSALEPFQAVADAFHWNVYCRRSSLGNSFPQHTSFCLGTRTTAPHWRTADLSEADTEKNRVGKKKGRLAKTVANRRVLCWLYSMPLICFQRIVLLFKARSSICHKALQTSP